MEDYITTLRRRIAFIMNVSAEIHLKVSPGGQSAVQKPKKTGVYKDFPMGGPCKKTRVFI